MGWAVGPAPLVAGVVTANQWVQFSVSTPAQHAIASALAQAELPYMGAPSFYAWLQSEYERKRGEWGG